MMNDNQGGIIANGPVINANNKNRNSISQTGVNIRRTQLISGTVGFILGIISSVIGSYIYNLIVS